MKKIKSIFTVIALTVFTSIAAFAQLQTPSLSPASNVSQVVGFTKININYSSPGVKGRKIFGEIEKYDVTWRAGANAQTIIEFSTPVSVGGQNLGAGKYSIFITPTASGDWTIHLNKKAESVFAYMVDGKIDEAAVAKDDAVSLKGKTERGGGTTERLTYTISAGDNKTAMISMAWENIKVTFPVNTQVDQKLEQFKSQF